MALKLPMIWQTRIKEAVGQAEVLIDPFHCGQHCVYVSYNAAGTIDREGFAEPEVRGPCGPRGSHASRGFMGPMGPMGPISSMGWI